MSKCDVYDVAEAVSPIILNGGKLVSYKHYCAEMNKAMIGEDVAYAVLSRNNYRIDGNGNIQNA